MAKTLSGFANSSGGIIVWGIDARKNADGVDCATAIVELASPALLVTRLNSMTGDATSPLIDGIRHKAIINPETGHGVVATLVPENDAGPFMAKLGEQRYYKRSGDSFYQMEHFDLEDMFGRRRKPKLRMTLTPTLDNDTIKVVVRLTNTGRASARHAGFVMKFENAEVVRTENDIRDVSSLNPEPTVAFDYPNAVIHPNGTNLVMGHVFLRPIECDVPIKFKTTIYCEDASPHGSVWRFSLDKFSFLNWDGRRWTCSYLFHGGESGSIPLGSAIPHQMPI